MKKSLKRSKNQPAAMQTVGRGGGHCFLMAFGALLTFFVIDLTSLKNNKESRILCSLSSKKNFIFFA